MSTTIVDHKVVEKKSSKTSTAQRREPNTAQKAARQQTFDSIYKSERFTLKSALEAFIKP